MPKGVYQRTWVRPAAERLMDLVIPVPESGCWLFTGCLSKQGYGRFTVETGRNILAHRASYAAFVCDPGDRHVLHKCDVPCCVNPDHLYLGSQADNMKDAQVKGRTQRGERHRFARLTDAAVREIRTSKEKGSVLADRLGVSRNTVYGVRHNRTWAHVP